MSVLRIVMGLTWLYGGWYKATDPGYLVSTSPRFFGTDIAQYIGHSPISFLLRPMVDHAVIAAWFVMLSEIAIGLAVLIGISLQFATIGGFAMAIILWLSVSIWKVPFFEHSEPAWALGWIVLFLMERHQEKGRGRYADTLLPDLSDSREVVRIIFLLVLSVAVAFAGLQLR